MFAAYPAPTGSAGCGCSSGGTTCCQVGVEGSNPFARSINFPSKPFRAFQALFRRACEAELLRRMRRRLTFEMVRVLHSIRRARPVDVDDIAAVHDAAGAKPIRGSFRVARWRR